MYRPFRVIKSCLVEISVWIYKNDAIGDDIKIKRKVSAFFLPLHVYLAFIAILSLFFARLHG